MGATILPSACFPSRLAGNPGWRCRCGLGQESRQPAPQPCPYVPYSPWKSLAMNIYSELFSQDARNLSFLRRDSCVFYFWESLKWKEHH
jgi:hypothetical protein